MGRWVAPKLFGIEIHQHFWQLSKSFGKTHVVISPAQMMLFGISTSCGAANWELLHSILTTV